MTATTSGLTRDLIDDFIWNRHVELDVELARVHRAETLEIHVAWIQGLLHGRVPVRDDLQLRRHLAIDRRHPHDIQGQRLVVWREDDIEQGRGQVRVVLARVERLGLDEPDGGG